MKENIVLVAVMSQKFEGDKMIEANYCVREYVGLSEIELWLHRERKGDLNEHA